MTDAELADLRQSYTQRTLLEADVQPEAVAQFRQWLDEAVAARLPEPAALTLATVDVATGQPSQRVVLLKGLPDDAGFLCSTTNYDSRKGHELAGQPLAALNFFWPGLERQVRVEGVVEKAPAEMSTAYFQSRPRSSQVGAWASPQSQVIGSREELEDREHAIEARFAGQGSPTPPAALGRLRAAPPRGSSFGRAAPVALHDRLVYEREAGGRALGKSAAWPHKRIMN